MMQQKQNQPQKPEGGGGAARYASLVDSKCNTEGATAENILRNGSQKKMNTELSEGEQIKVQKASAVGLERTKAPSNEDQFNLLGEKEAIDSAKIISNEKAVRIILQELEDRIQEREKMFQDHTKKTQMKLSAAFEFLTEINTLICLIFLVLMAYSIDYEALSQTDLTLDTDKGEGFYGLMRRSTSQQSQKIAVFFIVFIILIFNLILVVHRVDFQVLSIDDKLQALVHKFKHELETPDTKQDSQQLPFQDTKEFSFHEQNCFTWAMRKESGQFIQIPNNTLVKGDIIKLQPGETAPALVVRQDFEIIEVVEKVENAVSSTVFHSQSETINEKKLKVFLVRQKKVETEDDENFVQKIFNRGETIETKTGINERVTNPQESKQEEVKVNQANSGGKLSFGKKQARKSDLNRHLSILHHQNSDKKQMNLSIQKQLKARQRKSSITQTKKIGEEKDLDNTNFSASVLVQRQKMSSSPAVQNESRKRHLSSNTKNQMTGQSTANRHNLGFNLKNHAQRNGSQSPGNLASGLDSKRQIYGSFARKSENNPRALDPKADFKAATLKVEKEQEQESDKMESLLEKFNREELNKEFRKKIKKYYFFKVKKTPCIQDLEEYIMFNTNLNWRKDLTALADKGKDDLIYYSNRVWFKSKFERFFTISWILCFLVDITYFICMTQLEEQRKSFKEFQLSDSHVLLVLIYFLVPGFLQVSEAWANVVVQILIDILQVTDYNKSLFTGMMDDGRSFGDKAGASNNTSLQPFSRSAFNKASQNYQIAQQEIQRRKSTGTGLFKQTTSEDYSDFFNGQYNFLEEGRSRKSFCERLALRVRKAIRFLTCGCLCKSSKRSSHHQESNQGQNFRQKNYQSKHDKKQKSKANRRNRKRNRKHQTPNEFYEEYNFQNRELNWDNFKNFWHKIQAGINPNENIVAQMASLTIFAFIDKEGIVTEDLKYIDEIALLDKRGEKQVIDMEHNQFTMKEDKIYDFEEKSKYFNNIDSLKALGLAMMYTKNPKLSNCEQELQEIFALEKIPINNMIANKRRRTTVKGKQQNDYIDNHKIVERLKHWSGFHFHNVLRQETETHQDCLCSLARRIGHSEQSYRQCRSIKQLWNISRNQGVKKSKETAQRDIIINRNDMDDDDEFAKRSIQDNNSFNESINTQNKIQVTNRTIEDADTESVDEFQMVKDNKLVFLDYKFMKMYEMKRQAGHCHILTTIAQNIANGSIESFTRGEASVILNECTDFWSGSKIQHIEDNMRSGFKNILAQWNEQYETIGFSYKPITEEYQEIIFSMMNNQTKEERQHQQFAQTMPKGQTNLYDDQQTNLQSQRIEQKKKRLREIQKDQIFLGFVAIKHHAKQEVNKLLSCFNEAGIRGVLFSKEGLLRAKAVAQDLGIETGWNSWISLDDNPEEKIKNGDGNLVLPFGIEEIKKHISQVDTVPLQVQVFCKSNHKRAYEMIEIYQENNDVVACIGNIMNSGNMKCFMQANISIGMMIEPSYRCKRCNGRITIEQKMGQEFKNPMKINQTIDKNRMMELKKPTILEKLSRDLTALACTFVFEANTNIYCIYPALRESRRLKLGIELTMLLAILSYCTLYMTFFISEMILGMNSVQFPLLAKWQYLVLLFVIFPFSCLSCLQSPWSQDIFMKRMVLHQRYLKQKKMSVLPYQKQTFIYSLWQSIMAAFFINIVRIINLFASCFFSVQNLQATDDLGHVFNEAAKLFMHIPWNKYDFFTPVDQVSRKETSLEAKDISSVLYQISQKEQHINFIFILVIITSIQIGKQDPLSIFGGFSPFFRRVRLLFLQRCCRSKRSNVQEGKESDSSPAHSNSVQKDGQELYNEFFIAVIISQYLLALLYLIAYILIGEAYAPEVQGQRTTSEALYSPLNWPSWLTFGLLLTYLLLDEKKNKREIKDKFVLDGKWMKIFFATRLGLWSPR